MNEKGLIEKESSEGTAKVIYILYLVSMVFGITGIIGLVMAYMNRGEAPLWLESHYQYQIRTFWIGTLYMLMGFLLTFILIGYLVFLFAVIWLIVRCVKGIKLVDNKEAHPDPESWMF